MPISTSHSPQTTDNIPITQISSKRQNLGGADDFNVGELGSEEVEAVKAAIGDFFYNNQSLGLGNNESGDCSE